MLAVENLSKRFRLFEKPSDRLVEALTGRTRHRIQVGLDKVSFRVEAGESLGIIGRNGAGKSTLLKILNGVLLPDAGRVEVDGKVAGLLELGTGFNPELSGRENIVANGLMLGLSKEAVLERLDAIIAFSELGSAVREPLRTYSSGMAMRLAFATAIHAEPRCFLVDEALAVGDAAFQQKCMQRIRAFQEEGGSIVFVSHDLNAVKMLCDRAIVLEGGRILAEGEPEASVNEYNRLIAGSPDGETVPRREDGSGYGDGSVAIVDARLRGLASQAATLSAGEELLVELMVRAHEAQAAVTAGILIRDRFGRDIFGINSYALAQPLALAAGEDAWLTFRIQVDLAPGPYTLTAALHRAENHLEACYHWCDNLLRFEVAGIQGPVFAGVCRLPAECTVQRGSASEAPWPAEVS